MIRSGPMPQGVSHDTDAARTGPGVPEPGDTSRPPEDQRKRQMHAAETRLLYENATTGIVVTIVIASVVAYGHWDLGPRGIVSAWLVYMLLVSAVRFVVAQWYWRASASDVENGRWNAAFVVGAAMAAAGWGGGAIMLYPSAQLMNEILLVFAVGGVMLGGASTLAARPEAFLAFLVPTGFLTSLRVASVGDEDHLLMGLLGAVFTVAVILTAWRFHLAIETSFRLRFDNQDLIESLQTAKNDAESLNRELELRVRDRTAKLIEQDRRKDEFLAMLAHELRNPLAPIRFALQALKMDSPRATAARAREVIDRQVAQLVRLVDDLLDVSRITANKIQLRLESLDLAPLMATAVESITAHAAAAGHTVHVQPPSAPVRVNGDGARLVQVFANILNNAVKFTPPGGHIWFTADLQSDEAVVRIRDTGDGNRCRRPPAGVRHVPSGGAGSRAIHERPGYRVDVGAAVSGDARRGRSISAVRERARERRSKSVCRLRPCRPRQPCGPQRRLATAAAIFACSSSKTTSMRRRCWSLRCRISATSPGWLTTALPQ